MSAALLILFVCALLQFIVELLHSLFSSKYMNLLIVADHTQG